MVARPMQRLLLRARQLLGWTERQLGEQLGSSHRSAVRWENGQSHSGASCAAEPATLVTLLDALVCVVADASDVAPKAMLSCTGHSDRYR